MWYLSKVSYGMFVYSTEACTKHNNRMPWVKTYNFLSAFSLCLIFYASLPLDLERSLGKDERNQTEFYLRETSKGMYTQYST